MDDASISLLTHWGVWGPPSVCWLFHYGVGAQRPGRWTEEIDIEHVLRPCCEHVVNMLWTCGEHVVNMW